MHPPVPDVLTWVMAAIVGLTALSFLLAATTLLLRITNLRRELRAHDLDARWRPLLLEVLEGDRAPEALGRRIDAGARGAFLEMLMQYAFVLRGAARDRLRDLAAPHMPMIERQLQDRDPFRRARAVHTIGVLGPRDRGALLVRAVADPSPMVAMTAAGILARTGDPAFAGPILASLDRFTQWGTLLVASMLATLGPGVGPALRRTFANPLRATSVRVAAAEALWRMSDLQAAATAATLLQTSWSREELVAALRLLQRVGRPEHAALVRPYCASPEYLLRLHAVGALATLGDEGDVALVRAALDDASQWVALRAARALLEMGARDVLAAVAAEGHPLGDLARQLLEEER